MGVKFKSLILREEHRLRVFENMVLRRIFEAKSDDVTGSWKWTGHVARTGRKGIRIGFWFGSQKERDC
jgi:hypothetical protein